MDASSALNLDITAMIAYVSALTNGGDCAVSPERLRGQPVLRSQAERELERPVKPELEALFRGKRLICCRSALDDFRSGIIDTSSIQA